MGVRGIFPARLDAVESHFFGVHGDAKGGCSQVVNHLLDLHKIVFHH